MNLGSHMSIAGGVHLALERGKEAGCNAVQLFVKSSNRWKARPLKEEEIAAFHKNRNNYRENFIMAHTSYLINLASPEPKQAEKSIEALVIETKRCEILGIPYLVLHPGSHKGSGEDEGIKAIAGNLDQVFSETSGFNTMILLETTAGQGNTIGHRFEHLAEITSRLKDKSRVGVCYDTCHSFAAGYDIRNKKVYEKTFSQLNKVIGFENLKAFHINDSKNDFNSRKDRHEHIGKGKIGKKAFSLLVNDSRFKNIPMVLETPKGKDFKEDRENLALLRSMRN
ncbi:MAG: deoxyribonuclease IV [Candidatus Krumholzibacteriota bacterium]|nr:deoxyribonuclease IV [Candidatus Krumholzibacteriota bacterium]